MQNEKIKSFLGQTVMFWACETNHKDNKTFWEEDYQFFLMVLSHLLTKLLTYSKAGFMPYYFIPKIKVIQSISVEERKETVQKTEAVLQRYS